MYFKKFYGLITMVAIAICLISQSNISVANASEQGKRITNNSQSPHHTLIAQASTGEFTLPPLPYSYDALDEYIDTETMTLHHDKHHAKYVKNLNEAIALYPDLQGQSVEDLLLNLDTLPEDIMTTVQNNGGGHANHTMFWSIMTPDSNGKPTGEIATAIDSAFGDFATFQTEFNDAGKKRFGSGWAWLVMNDQKELEVTSTANQDSPLMENQYPIMGNDVWEHAYYLKYRNQREDYLNSWWNVVNWDEVNNRFKAANSFFE
jgi:Fe-Mn family superoxide dismutase